MTKKTSKNAAKTDKNEIVVSFEGVKIKDFRAYWDAVRRGDWKGQDAFFAKVVKSWPYDLDPADVESYGELELTGYSAVQAAIKEKSRMATRKFMRVSD